MNIVQKFKHGLKKSSKYLTINIIDSLKSKKISIETIDEIESVLISADLGLEVTNLLIEKIKHTKNCTQVNKHDWTLIKQCFENHKCIFFRKNNQILKVLELIYK